MLAGSRLFRALPERRFRQVILSFAVASGAGTAIAAAFTSLMRGPL
jgi:hypothetical protein